VSEFVSEVERRRLALELAAGGMTDSEAAATVGRSRQWLHKWRVRQAGDGSIDERSRTPNRQPTKTSEDVTAAVLAVRTQLEQDPVASIGAISILATMERAGFEPLPSERTIERILTTRGRSHPRLSKRTGPKRRLPLPDVAGVPGVWQQSDWIHDRYLRGGIVFNSLQTADVGSAGITAGQYVRRTVRNAVTFLLEQAWPVLSIPQAMSVDNAFVKTSHPNNPWTAWTLMCLFFGVEVIVSPPGGLGWTNHIEAVNNLWQQRTIRRHLFVSLDEVRAGSDQACHWFNHQRPIHDPAIHGTRYPSELIAAHTAKLRWPPTTTITDHLDQQDRLAIPLTTGRVTYLRHVENNTIDITNNRWTVPNLTNGALVAATITTSDKTLTINHQGQTITRHHYPINQPTLDPYYPPALNSLLHHL
jgi:transposase